MSSTTVSISVLFRSAIPEIRFIEHWKFIAPLLTDTAHVKFLHNVGLL
jgi:hypothetical protein